MTEKEFRKQVEIEIETDKIYREHYGISDDAKLDESEHYREVFEVISIAIKRGWRMKIEDGRR